MNKALRSSTSSGCVLDCREAVGRTLVGTCFNCCLIEGSYGQLSTVFDVVPHVGLSE